MSSSSSENAFLVFSASKLANWFASFSEDLVASGTVSVERASEVSVVAVETAPSTGRGVVYAVIPLRLGVRKARRRNPIRLVCVLFCIHALSSLLARYRIRFHLFSLSLPRPD